MQKVITYFTDTRRQLYSTLYWRDISLSKYKFIEIVNNCEAYTLINIHEVLLFLYKYSGMNELEALEYLPLTNWNFM